MSIAFTGMLVATGLIASSLCVADEAKPPLRVFVCTPTSDYPPFYVFPLDAKEPTGHEVDVARALGKAMDRKVVFAWPPAEEFDLRRPRISIIRRRQADLVISSFTITAERRKHVAFSHPYFDDGLGVLVKADSPIKSVDDLAKKTVVALRHTTAYPWAQRHLPDATVWSRWEDAPEDVATDFGQVLKLGQADAYITDRSNLLAMAKADDGLRLLPDRLTMEQWGVAVHRDDDDLLKEVNQAIERLEASGELRKLYAKWLERDDG